MASTYGRILSEPGASSFSIAGLIARFPMSMFGISTILAIQSLYGNYSAAGTVSAANIVAAAVGAPALARLVDVHGQSRVMLPAVLGSIASEVALVVATTQHAPLWLLILLTALGGGLAGSMGSLVRSRWTVVLSKPEEIHTAFSLEAAFDEVAFIIGPVLATALCTTPALPVTSGWIAAITLQTVGSLWFLAQRSTEPAPHPRPSRRRKRLAEGSPGRERDLTALAAAPLTPVLRNGAVIAVIAIFLASGAMFGANDVAVVAFATEAGRKSASGVVLAAWGVGSLTAALVYGSRTWSWPMWKQIALGTIVLAVGASTFMLAPNLVVLSVLMVLTGMSIAPTVTTGNNIVQAVVAPSQLTEGLAWLSTSMNVGVSLGSVLAGHAVDAGGSHGGYLLVAACGWLSVVGLLGGLRVIQRAKPHRSIDAA